jgi:hypothetical protein
MRTALIVVSVLIVFYGTPSLAWQAQQQLQPMYVPTQAPANPVPHSNQIGPAQNYVSPPVPAPQYQRVSPQAQSVKGQGQYPQYPYPQYRNPYFDGMSPRAMLSDTLEWFFTLPAHVMGKFSEFMDSTAFPQKPATHGGTHQPSTQEQYPRNATSIPMQNGVAAPSGHPGNQIPQNMGR